MHKYKNKSVEVEAFRFNGSSTHLAIIKGWVNGGKLPDGEYICTCDCGVRFEIKTSEGTMQAIMGDWIIKGEQGELYLRKPDVFKQTYEPVEDG